jgi:hypothetical protein
MKRYEVLLQKNDTPAKAPPSGLQQTANIAEPRLKSVVEQPDVDDQSFAQSIDGSTDRSIVESTGQSVNRLTGQSTVGSSYVTVDRPKAFYITKRLNQRLDQAVRYYQDVHGIKRVDRSAVVNAMLENEANWTDQSLDQLVDRVMGLLTSRLTD